MFGFGGKYKEKPLKKVDAKYVGGHAMYPKEKDTKVEFYDDRLVVKLDPHLIMPYEKIKGLSGQEDKRITKTRVIMTGVFVGLFWKKIFRYIVIEFNDGLMDHDVTLDFHRSAKEVQQLLYRLMLDNKNIAEKERLR